MVEASAEVGFDESSLVARVAATPAGSIVAAGLDDGRVWTCDLTGQRIAQVKADKGPAICALALTPDGRRVAWGDEEGGAGVAEAGL